MYLVASLLGHLLALLLSHVVAILVFKGAFFLLKNVTTTFDVFFFAHVVRDIPALLLGFLDGPWIKNIHKIRETEVSANSDNFFSHLLFCTC